MSNELPSSFNQQWDLGSRHSGSAPPAETLSASQSILESLRKRRGSETAQWLNKLTSESSQNSPTVSQQGLNSISHEMSPEELREHELVRWLDKLFDQFDLYAAHFNQTAQGTDLVVTCNRPPVVNPTNNRINLYDDPEQPVSAETVFEGHLVTRYWAMYVRGTVGTVKVFIFPAEILLGFSLHKVDESVYGPLLVIESELRDEKLVWHIAGTSIVITQVAMLAKELFGDLIRVASGQMSETELFAHPLQEMNLGDNLAVGYKAPPPSPRPVQSIPVVQETVKTNPNKGPFSLSSLQLAQSMLASIETDISQLFQLGKTALAADDTVAFRNIKVLTEKMETLKATLTEKFSEIARITDADATAKKK